MYQYLEILRVLAHNLSTTVKDVKQKVENLNKSKPISLDGIHLRVGA